MNFRETKDKIDLLINIGYTDNKIIECLKQEGYLLRVAPAYTAKDYIGDQRRSILTQNIVENTPNFGSDDNQIHLTRKMKRYLLDIYKWYYKNDVDESPYANDLDIKKLWVILVNGWYRKGNKEFLNNIKRKTEKIKKKYE